MRIEKLRFSNINSLRGTWLVNFEDPELQDAGLVLITGPTGSGKSTLLDAICLALYGRTPRLDSIAKSGNEAMTRRTGTCFAEVVYSTDRGRYRVRWSQRRARNKPGGNLQNPEYEFEDCAEDGKVSTGKSAVQDLVRATTGMTFEQFTRSMLLAQGQFARFLQAKPDERTTILEEITGTKIYAEISRRTHERARAAELACLRLEEKLNAFRILTSEQREQTQRELDAVREKETAVHRELTHSQQGLAWLRTGQSLAANLEKARTDAEQAFARDAALASEKAALVLDARAASLDAPLSALSRDETACTRLKKDLAAALAALPGCEKMQALAEERVATAAKAQEAADTALHAAEPVLKSVRACDTRRAAALQKKTELAKLTADVEKSLADNAARYRVFADRERTCGTRLAECDKLLADTAADAGLAGDMRVIAQSLEALDTAASELAKERRALTKAAKGTDQCSKKVASSQKKLANAEQECARLAASAAEKAGELARITGEGGLQRLAAVSLAGRELVSASGALAISLKEYLAACTSVLETRHELTHSAADKERLTVQLPGVQQVREKAARQVELLEENARLKAAIMSLEEHRAHLAPGTPCPCCGSLDHPWASEVPLTFAGEAEFAQAKAALTAARAAEQAVLLEMTTCENTRARLFTQLSTQQHSLGERAATLAQDLAVAEAACTKAGAFPGEDMPLGTLPDLFAGTAQLEGLAGKVTADSGAVAQAAAGADVPLEDVALADAVYEALRCQVQAAQESVLAGLGAARTSLTKVCGALEEKKARASAMDEALSMLRSRQAAAENARTKAEGELTSAAQAKSAAEQVQTDLEERCAACASACAERKAAVLTLLAPYGVGEDGLTKHLAQDLQDRLTARTQCETMRDELVRTQGELEIERAGLASEKEQAVKQAQSLAGSLADAEAECGHILEERRALFGDKDPDQEETLLRASCTAAGKEVQEAAAALTAARQALSAALGQRDAVQSQLQDAEKQLGQSREAFERALAAEGFASRTDLLAARLSTEERTRLEGCVQEARDEVTKTGTRVQQLIEERERHCADPLASEFADKPAEELAAAIAGRQAELTALTQQTGVLTERLACDARLRKERSQESERVDAARRTARQWKELGELIGSADGKKFRNFAQEVTFVHLVRSANEEIRRLTDRYLLTTAPDNALDFNVIDTWQGNEQRSIRNLSGGESFLVSLALALGLASLSGAGRMHIETMFLDEGFGTLDPDALDSAISTLAGLRGRGTGLVGIISHVEALQERVCTQIVLSRGADGVSRLSGPGCSAQ